jgi:hypothetical protein
MGFADLAIAFFMETDYSNPVEKLFPQCKQLEIAYKNHAYLFGTTRRIRLYNISAILSEICPTGIGDLVDKTEVITIEERQTTNIKIRS